MSPEAAATEAMLRKAVAKGLKLPEDSINEVLVIKRSVDARKHPVVINVKVRAATGSDLHASLPFIPVDYDEADPAEWPKALIVGAGPAGLFAALECLRLGLRPIVLERGKDVDARRLDLANISRQKKIDPESNYCFGEGGAGAYSDGKLYTRSKKRGENDLVLRTLVQHGASEKILVDSHPHIGSDRLPQVIRNMRNTIIKHGGEVHFQTCVTGLLKDGKGNAIGVQTETEKIMGDAVIVASGHSARDTFRMLKDAGVAMEAKGIAVGVRLEHPQHLIDQLQYHSPKGRGKWLPAAEYSYVTQVDGRGVYSFCMCPGGVIVPAGSADGELVVNGMSASARAGEYANSGMVVEVRPGDMPEYSGAGPMEMLALQEDLEAKMYNAAGNTLTAPAQRMLDFTQGKKSKSLPRTSYAPGICSMDFHSILPPFISHRLSEGFKEFGRKSKGFLTNDAILVGLESRTSSPIRLTRDTESLVSTNTGSLFPAGEGAGYAGGIVSAAIDGIRCARAAALSLNRTNKCETSKSSK